MTLLSRRKRRTTARRITPATLAAKLAAFAALVATPALAQPPPSAYQPPSNSPANYQPLNMQNYQPAGGQPAAWQQPAGGQPGGLPLPPGYRPRTPPPQAQPQTRATTPSGALPGSGGGGQVMYFQKPADALTATGNSDDAAGVAQLGSGRSGPAADVQPTTLPPLPASRYPTTAGSDFASAPPPPQPRYLPEMCIRDRNGSERCGAG